MTEQMQTIRDDLAYLREMTLACEPEAAQKGGTILAAAGVIFAAASVAAWAATQGLLPFPMVAWAWWVALIVFAGVLTIVLVRGPRSQGVRDRASGTAWAAIGSVIFTVMIGLQVMGSILNTPVVFAVMPTLVLACYGAGWSVASAMSRRRWMTAVATGAHVGAVAIAFLVNRPVIYLAYAAALLLLLTAPGLVLVGRRR